MGGTFQHKEFLTLAELVVYLIEQIAFANEVGLYLMQGEIKQKPFPDESFEWSAYFSK